MELHTERVKAIQASVRNFYELKRPFRIYHGATNSTRYCHRSVDNTVDTSSLNHVLAIDIENKTALVEANVPMDALLLATLEHNLVPLVVMEFPGITAGGAYSGTAGESSTFRHGFFETTVNSVEIVLADGSVVLASRNDNQDLFWGAASSFGTIGVVTMLNVQLRDAAEAVKLTYYPATTTAEAVDVMEREMANPDVEYLDGIIYDKTTIVVCSGRLAPLPSGIEAQQFLRPQDSWFSIHVSNRMKGITTPITEYIPLTDYLFRYDRGGFWVAKYAFDYFRKSFNDATRTKHDRFLHARVMYHALHASGLAKENIVQDVAVPFEAAPVFHKWLDEVYGIYPLWICPLRQRRDGGATAQHGLHADLADPATTPEFIMNFGIWGPGSKKRAEFVQQNRLLEAKVQQLCGKKWLYAHTYYTEHEFWDIYPKREYDALRSKYKATHLPSVYDKVKVDVEAEQRRIRASWKARLLHRFWNIWPLRGLYGHYMAAGGGDYLLKVPAPTV